MVKSCCWIKPFISCSLDRRCKWIAAIKRKNWEPNQHSFFMLWSLHYRSGSSLQGSSLSRRVFQYTDSPTRKKTVKAFKKYQNRKTLLRRKIVRRYRKKDRRRKERRESCRRKESCRKRKSCWRRKTCTKRESCWRRDSDERAAEEVESCWRRERAAVSVSTQTDFTSLQFTAIIYWRWSFLLTIARLWFGFRFLYGQFISN